MIYLKIGDTYYPASFFQTTKDSKWGNRPTFEITVGMSHAEAVELFVNGLQWEHVNQMDGEPVVTDYSEYEMAGPITDNRNGTITAKMGKALANELNAALTGENTALTVRETTELRGQMETVYQLATPSMTPDEVIQNRIMCKPWEKGSHTVGEVYMVGGQPWQCYQDYDNAVYPDIVPGSTAWPTFNKPYHGTTPETALPFVAPTHAEDRYKDGEYMIWTDGTLQLCVRDTAYGPDNDPNAWEVQA